VVHEEDRTVIKCLSATPVFWYYFREVQDTHFQIKNNAQLNLYLMNVNMNGSGFYECRGTTLQGQKFSAHSKLIVIGNKFYCVKLVL